MERHFCRFDHDLAQKSGRPHLVAWELVGHGAFGPPGSGWRWEPRRLPFRPSKVAVEKWLFPAINRHLQGVSQLAMSDYRRVVEGPCFNRKCPTLAHMKNSCGAHGKQMPGQCCLTYFWGDPKPMIHHNLPNKLHTLRVQATYGWWFRRKKCQMAS